MVNAINIRHDEGAACVGPIPPHGGRLITRLAIGEDAQVLAEQALALPSLVLTPRQLSDVELIAVGALSPLEGFMNRSDYRAVVDEMHLANGLPWTLPITLAVGEEGASRAEVGATVALADGDGALALLEVSDHYCYDKRLEARLVYGTDDQEHPGVAAVYQQGEVLLAGKVTVFRLPDAPGPASAGMGMPALEALGLRMTPSDTRRLFAARAWERVVGFQTRNPIHRAHEYLQKCALEIADGLLIHPLVGETKRDDVPTDVRLRCYRVLVDRYFPKDRVVLAALPAAMRYAGPREAIFHALVRKNYGCTHFIVGRDHAGVGSYYGSYDAQRIFERFDADELGITPLFFDHAFYCRSCAGMATAKTCPHGEGERVSLSGTRLREMLSRGELPPAEFTRPEVAEVLMSVARSPLAAAG